MNPDDKLDGDINSEKKMLRANTEKKRQLLCRRDAQKASISIVQNFCDTWRPLFGSIVSAFWPFREELDVRPLIYRLKAEGYTIALPQVVAKKTPLLFRELKPATPLLADKYGVWGLKKFMGREYMGVNRTTFIIDKDRKLKHVIEKVNTKIHHDDVLAVLSDL